MHNKLWKMFFYGFEWSDILLGHYLFSLFFGVLVVVITFIVSMKFNIQNGLARKYDSVSCNHQNSCDEMKSDISGDILSKAAVTKSPAIAAEKVIQANMTEEQRKLEHEVRRQQLAQIHELMLKQREKFGNISLSEVEEQMKLYQ